MKMKTLMTGLLLALNSWALAGEYYDPVEFAKLVDYCNGADGDKDIIKRSFQNTANSVGQVLLREWSKNLRKKIESDLDCPDPVEIDIENQITELSYAAELKVQDVHLIRNALRVADFRDPTPDFRYAITQLRERYPHYSTKTIDWYLWLFGSSVKEITERGKQAQKEVQKSCSNVDLSKQAKWLRGKNEDQQDTGWCYAFTAADMVSFKIGGGVRISPVDMANSYILNAKPNDYSRALMGTSSKRLTQLGGGYAYKTVEYANKTGFCAIDDLPAHAQGDWGDYTDAIDELQLLKDEIENHKAYYEEIHTVGDYSKCQLRPEVSDLLPGLELEEVYDVLIESNRTDYINKLFVKACKNRIPGFQAHELNVRTTLISDGFSPEDVFKHIDEELENGNLPGLSFHAVILSDKRDAGRDGGHITPVVARRFNKKTKSCEYLLRNSWGDDCDGYDPSLKCESGNIWVPKEYLIQATKGAQSI